VVRFTKDPKKLWESIYRDFPERFGTEPSHIDLNVLKMLIEEGARDFLESAW
jgi:hypothetical protein